MKLGKDDVGIQVKKDLCESVVEIRRRRDRMKTMRLIFGEEMIRVICVYAPRSRKPDIQKGKLYDQLVHEWYMKGKKELILGIGDSNGLVGNMWIDLKA